MTNQPENDPKPDTIHVCLHQPEISTVRSWQRTYPALLGIMGACTIAIAAHSCSVARQAGALESDVSHITSRVVVLEGHIEQLRSNDVQIERSASDVQGRVLIQLGRLEAQLTGISERIGRVEDQMSVDRGMARPRQH